MRTRLRLFSEKVGIEGNQKRVKRGDWWFAGWTGLIVLIVVPWAGFQNHSHWQRVGWMPFMSPEVRVRDSVLNVLLYLPLGYLYVRRFPGRFAVLKAIAFATVLSVMTETSQVYSHGRFPSMTDVTCNVFGVWLGAVWRSRFDREVKRVANRDRGGSM